MDLTDELKKIIIHCGNLEEIYSKLSAFFDELREQGMKDYQIDNLIRKTKELINDEIDKKIMEELAKGQSPTAIGEKVGLKSSAIKNRIKNMRKKGIIIPEVSKSKKTTNKKTRRKTKNDKKDNEILDRLSRGETTKEIAIGLGITSQAVTYRMTAMRKRGTIIPNARAIRKAKIDDRILQELEKGTKRDKIAELLGFSYYTILKKISKIRKQERELNKKLATEIVKLIQTKHATIRQVRKIADYYRVDIEEVLNSLDEQER